MLSFACLDFTSSDDCYISTTRHAKRGTKVRGINQIIPIYPSRSEYARKCPKTVSKTSQQTCCLRELRFLDEIKKYVLDFDMIFIRKAKNYKNFVISEKFLLNWFQKYHIEKNVRKLLENYCMYMHVFLCTNSSLNVYLLFDDFVRNEHVRDQSCSCLILRTRNCIN